MTYAAAKNADGTYPNNAEGYPVVYITQGGLVVCPRCANEPDTSDPVVGSQVDWEGPDHECDDCGRTLETAYGDPEANGGKA